MFCEEKCFTFTWKLENISYSVQKKGTAIHGPYFVVDLIDEAKWYLQLYPRGQDDESYIAFYLFREAENHVASQIEINYELAFLDKDGSVLSHVISKYNFPKHKGHGSPNIANRGDVFFNERSAFLPQDTLTTRCRIWKNVGELTDDVQCFARTRIGVQKRSFLWNIKNFSTLDGMKKYSYEVKSLDRLKNIMSLNLSLRTESSCEEVIYFELSLRDQAIKFSTLRLCLIDAVGTEVECNKEEFWFHNWPKSKEFKFSFSKKKLVALKDSYLTGDILSLQWEMVFSKGVISKEIEDVQYGGIKSESELSKVQNLNNQKIAPVSYTLNDQETNGVSFSLNTHLKSLLDENFLCDVKLKTSTRTFNAHKLVLSASSSVFKAMFSTDMREKDSGCIHIADLSDDIIDLMLTFTYTASVENLNSESASQLYVAADKYAIFSLKILCSSYMKDNLCPSNACDVLLLSDLHADTDFKSDVQKYILQNVKDIITSDGWRQLMETNGKLAAETLCLQYK